MEEGTSSLVHSLHKSLASLDHPDHRVHILFTSADKYQPLNLHAIWSVFGDTTNLSLAGAQCCSLTALLLCCQICSEPRSDMPSPPVAGRPQSRHIPVLAPPGHTLGSPGTVSDTPTGTMCGAYWGGTAHSRGKEEDLSSGWKERVGWERERFKRWKRGGGREMAIETKRGNT